ncbi:methyltransferase domain-containing protein [Thermospira aquatica]|uniref:Methyltransferase domain-containing protein n=1 Tax=Thermospira aquatica TaxID=2828656 RepID=A0AAX3BCZ8_9SPIR|nr:methyltransferase domain-containing protein [Thermospira aquatica]URA09894.1 methyltransferase domain-containing protein [Thermospira aquatica]
MKKQRELTYQEKKNCPLCGGEAGFFREIDRWQPPLTIWRCGECHFQFQPKETEEAAHLYDEGYYTGTSIYTYQDERQHKDAAMAVWRSRVNALSRLEKSTGPKRWLDVGCAFGGLLEAAKEKGYEPYGLEISEYSGGYARTVFPGHIWIGNVEDFDLPQDFFSVVSLVEVIEHLAHPMKALERVYRSLQEGGLLLVQTADMDGLQARFKGENYHYYLPGHLSYFDRHNLALVLRRVGFRRIRFIGGVEFGLLPKLIKSRDSFHSLWDYRHWIRISLYHLASKITIGPWHLTSSMVMLAWK